MRDKTIAKWPVNEGFARELGMDVLDRATMLYIPGMLESSILLYELQWKWYTTVSINN